MEEADCVVIGAGVVGLAVARALARHGREVIVLERERSFGFGISSRNSEVIHAGIYYDPGSMKARLCRSGRDALYEYVARYEIKHRRCGKFIVATCDSQLEGLQRIAALARSNGVEDLEWFEADRAKRLEPHLACVAALHSPSTGIIDTHEYMLSLLGDAQAHGAMIAFDSQITAMAVTPRGVAIMLDGEQTPAVVAKAVVNSAGLEAHRVAATIAEFPSAHIPEVKFAKGNYFVLRGRAPFDRLIYPLPEPGGLGVHLTLDLNRQARFGPDVEWVATPEYDVAPSRADRFYDAIRRYWPGLRDGQLLPGYAGVRPKVPGNGSCAPDFLVSTPAEHGVPGVFNLFGIESPGITASLALAEHVSSNVMEQA